LKMAREGLVVDLRTAVTNAIRKGAAVRQAGVRLSQKAANREIAIEVVPFQMPPATESLYLVVFEELPTPALPTPSPKGGKRVTAQKEQRKAVTKLEQELACTRES